MTVQNITTIVVVFFTSSLVKAQLQENKIPTELFVNTNSIALESFWFKPIDSSKIDFFSYVNFDCNYSDSKKNQTYFQGLFTYNFNSFFGVSAGANAINGSLSPTLALSFQNEGDKYYWNIFPSIELKKNSNFDIWGIIIAKPSYKRLTFFTQAIIEANFNSKNNNFISENLRLGYNFKDKLQLGFGINISQTGNHYEWSNSPGIFFRREF